VSVNCSSINIPLSATSEIRSDGIKIWYGLTVTLFGFYHQLHSLLNKDEQVAAARFHRDDDRKRYVIQHGVLRLLLSRLLDISAVDIAFSFNKNGKPSLQGTNLRACFFNLSHSAGEFLIAIGDEELGIDLEKMDPAFEWQDIATRYFSAAELEFITTAPNPTEAFFLLWTRKEALLKACGMSVDDNLPGIPALDGTHQLPGNYPEKNLHTRSFTVNANFIASITYPLTETNLSLVEIDAVLVQALL